MKASKQKLETVIARKCLQSKEVFESSGLNNRTWIRVLNGEEVRPRTLGLISKALGVDVTEILADQ